MAVTCSVMGYTTSCYCVLTLHCRYQRARFYRGWGFGIGIFTTVTLIVILSVMFSIRYQDDNQTDNYFAPGDTRIISYSPSFCEGLTLSGDADATLYLLEKQPLLSDPTNQLTATAPSPIRADTYEYLYYYLHPNSKVNFTYCISGDGKSLSFDLIKGSDNFNDWKDDGDSSHSKTHFNIENLCSQGMDNRSFPSNFFTSGDTYYFAFDNLDNSRDVTLMGTLVFNRTEYLPQAVKNSCSIMGGSCSVSIPLNSDYVAMVKVGNSSAGAEDNISISWSCTARVWLYVVVVLVPLIFVVSLMLIMCAVCVFYARHRSQKYSALSAAEVTQPVDTTTVTTTVTPTAPPYNPTPPGYGATPTAYEKPLPDY